MGESALAPRRRGLLHHDVRRRHCRRDSSREISILQNPSPVGAASRTSDPPHLRVAIVRTPSDIPLANVRRTRGLTLRHPAQRTRRPDSATGRIDPQGRAEFARCTLLPPAPGKNNNHALRQSGASTARDSAGLAAADLTGNAHVGDGTIRGRPSTSYLLRDQDSAPGVQTSSKPRIRCGSLIAGTQRRWIRTARKTSSSAPRWRAPRTRQPQRQHRRHVRC